MPRYCMIGKGATMKEHVAAAYEGQHILADNEFVKRNVRPSQVLIGCRNYLDETTFEPDAVNDAKLLAPHPVGEVSHAIYTCHKSSSR